MNNIKVIEGSNTQIKSATTKSIDVHLTDQYQHYINVVLPNGNIVVVTPVGTSIYDSTDTLLDTISC